MFLFFTLETRGFHHLIWRKRRMAFTSQPAAQDKMNAAKRTVLIVEDDPGNAEMLDLLLQSEDGYQALYFPSAEEVLAHLDIIQDHRPTLFVFDFTLPKMNGLDLYRQLHATEGLQAVRVIIVTGSLLTDQEKLRLTELGLVTINKPYDIDDMLDTIRQMTA